MPPKPKINREMIIDAAYEIVRESGEENVNARNRIREKPYGVSGEYATPVGYFVDEAAVEGDIRL